MPAPPYAAPEDGTAGGHDSPALGLVVREARALAADGRPICAAIGFFDGVHLGHQRVIRQALTDARHCGGLAVAITFDTHPRAIVAPQRNPALIYPLAKRQAVLGELGISTILLLHFDAQLSQQSGEQFVRRLVADCGQLRSLSVGTNFHFGHQRKGNLALLTLLGQELKFAVHGHPPVEWQGHAVSSSRIRDSLRHGRWDEAGAMLGRPYGLCARVVRGDRRGRQLGFPTANLDAAHLVLPPHGVYAGRVAHAGQWHPAVLNLGVRPTLRQTAPSLRVEAHLLDFTDDLYDQELEVRFVRRLRPEQTFASLPELQAQIARDVTAARQALAEARP